MITQTVKSHFKTMNYSLAWCRLFFSYGIPPSTTSKSLLLGVIKN